MLPSNPLSGPLARRASQLLMDLGFRNVRDPTTARSVFRQHIQLSGVRPMWGCSGPVPAVDRVTVSETPRTGMLLFEAQGNDMRTTCAEITKQELLSLSIDEQMHLKFYGCLPEPKSKLQETAELSAEFVELRSTIHYLRQQLQSNGHDVVADLSNHELVEYVIEITGGFIHDVIVK